MIIKQEKARVIRLVKVNNTHKKSSASAKPIVSFQLSFHKNKPSIVKINPINPSIGFNPKPIKVGDK